MLNKIQKLINSEAKLLNRKVKIMEVCGTHTASILRYAIPQMLPKNIELVSGPGCPVCVTSASDIDKIHFLTETSDVIIATFGDMLKVRGSKGSLSDARLKGAQVDVIYSPLQALEIAKNNPNKKVILIACGFETTAPAFAETLKEAGSQPLANKQNIKNLFVLNMLKIVPPAMDAILSSENDLDAFLLPGHVSVITGADYFKFIAEKFQKPATVTGFKADEILLGILALLKRLNQKNPTIDNTYSNVVKAGGNKLAMQKIFEVFEVADVSWRGFGIIPNSGLELKKEYEKFSAIKHFNIPEIHTPEPKGCMCADVLKGKITPNQCKLFGKVCTPQNAVGPCMVSAEGCCRAWFLYKS